MLVSPYHKVHGDDFACALLRRSDAGTWQTIAGGGEGDETPLEAAKREACEEASIPAGSAILPLDTVEPTPVTEFGEGYLRGDSVYVIPQYCYGVLVEDGRIMLSREHTEYV